MVGMAMTHPKNNSPDRVFPVACQILIWHREITEQETLWITQTGDTEMTTVYAINAAAEDHLEKVIAEMKVLGAPKIRVVDCGDYLMALEGSHRLAAAKILDLQPEFSVIDQDEMIDISEFDWFDSADFGETVVAAGEVAGWLFCPRSAVDYTF
jgi:hypothetical protein